MGHKPPYVGGPHIGAQKLKEFMAAIIQNVAGKKMHQKPFEIDVSLYRGAQK